MAYMDSHINLTASSTWVPGIKSILNHFFSSNRKNKMQNPDHDIDKTKLYDTN